MAGKEVRQFESLLKVKTIALKKLRRAHFTSEEQQAPESVLSKL